MQNKIEIQVVVDDRGVKCVRIVGPSEEHEVGHKLYFEIRDLIDNLDKAIQDRINEKSANENQELHS